MTGELDTRQGGNTLPAWAACWFFGLVLMALAVAEYLYVTDFEREGGHPVVAKRQERSVRRSPFAQVAEWGHPRIGMWGCVAIFAAPGAALLATGVLLKRRVRT